MKRSLVAVLLVTSLVACQQKKDDCIDPNTFENRCVEKQLSRNDDPPLERNYIPLELGNPGPQPTNIWPEEHHTTTVVEHRVIVQEKPKSSWLPAIGGAIGGWLGKKYADRKAAQQTVSSPSVVAPSDPQKPAVRVVPIVPAARPYVPPPPPVYAPPRPSYTYSKPTYSSPTVTVRPSPTPSYRSSPSVTVRSR